MALGIDAMGKAIERQFSKAATAHRVRNFAEELSLALGDCGSLPMELADKAVTSVKVSDVPTRSLGRCLKIVERTLAKHLLSEEATVRKVP